MFTKDPVRRGEPKYGPALKTVLPIPVTWLRTV